jgi:hypothetical protein
MRYAKLVDSWRGRPPSRITNRNDGAAVAIKDSIPCGSWASSPPKAAGVAGDHNKVGLSGFGLFSRLAPNAAIVSTAKCRQNQTVFFHSLL